MGGDRFEEARDLFLAVLDVSPSERAAFLADRCGDDRPLRAEVERLLAEDAATDSFMDGPATVPNRASLDIVHRAGLLHTGWQWQSRAG